MKQMYSTKNITISEKSFVLFFALVVKVISPNELGRYYLSFQNMMLEMQIDLQNPDPWALSMIDSYQIILFGAIQIMIDKNMKLNLEGDEKEILLNCYNYCEMLVSQIQQKQSTL